MYCKRGSRNTQLRAYTIISEGMKSFLAKYSPDATIGRPCPM